MKIYPQAQTPRKSSKLKPLTAEDKAYNHALSKERSKVENIFAKVKTFKMFSTIYRNHRKRFGLRMNLIAGEDTFSIGSRTKWYGFNTDFRFEQMLGQELIESVKHRYG
ncbi:transposase-like protein, IS1381 ISSpn7 [Streptococcus pneumoniae]|nr:transposase-like protein, IS1381 ISSpn7 [Streptococcus pneumoniae]